MRKELKNKIRSKKGETLIETLVALLIGVLALMMLPWAIVGAVKANKTSAEQSVYGEEAGTGQVVVSGFTIE